MIELGLARIGRLLSNSLFSWKAVHVAGTNGKGSVCAYISAMLHAGRITCGRFNSPHLIDRWDCISINEKVVDKSLFHNAEAMVRGRNIEFEIGASEFEVLTATAFEIFAREEVQIGIVEVGMGGRLDATNVLENPLVTVITKIGLDHQAFLGNTLEEIAYEKAGILKARVSCVIDGTNPPGVLDVVRNYARLIGAGPMVEVGQDACEGYKELNLDELESHQQTNIRLAHETVRQVLFKLRSPLNADELLPSAESVVWPGRLQNINIQKLTGRRKDILVDGAHNVQSAEALGLYVNRRLRQQAQPVTWIIALSSGKDISQILAPLISTGDKVLAVQFGPVDGMPWVRPSNVNEVLEAACQLGGVTFRSSPINSVTTALQKASEIAGEGPMVVAGSLYLISDVFRLLRHVWNVE